MGRILIATGFTPSEPKAGGAALALENPHGHTLSIHPVSSSCVRVVHQLPPRRFSQKVNGEIAWEESDEAATIRIESNGIELQTTQLTIKINYKQGCPRLEWFRRDGNGQDASEYFMADSHTRAYSYDAASGAVHHYVERENYLPVSEDEFTTPGNLSFLSDERNEFVYGLGESRGTLEKSGKRFTMEGRDALSYSWTEGDPLYKLCPFYTVYNKATGLWHGVFYNSLVDSVLDMGAESDVLWGCFRSYKSNSGPLDYYVLTGDGSLPSILTEYASLISPHDSNSPFTTSPVLPPLSQFGYLSSSLSLAADPQAQEAVLDFLKTSRKEGFPIDGLYLSSGWCQDSESGDRNYFSWNTARYPDPTAFGREVEQELEVQVIVNVKPWLLDVHPFIDSAEQVQAFVGAPDDARGDPKRSSEGGSHKSWVWSSGFAAHKLGSYFDFSSIGGSQWWREAISKHVLAHNLTGVWIDNNEMAGLVDDEATFKGEVGMWNATGVASNVEKRMGWGSGASKVGAVGKAIQTMGMARATFEAVMEARPDQRPVIVSRSGVPGIHAYAHASWSGDNSTTWQALKWGTKMTLSVGMSMGPGLYGHDIGGFAGKHHPSPELLVRWVQNGAWHSRFTVHSWKEVSTTLWMYNNEPGISESLRKALDFRYRLAPTFYSLYVTHYFRQGWPLLKPLLWYHSQDPNTLRMDEEFIFGTHVLVAPVTEKGARTRSVYLPSVANDGQAELEWCELDSGKWHQGKGDFVELDAPLDRTPVLVRGGGIVVLGGVCSKNIYDGQSDRTALIFPTASSSAGATGSFDLIADDGRTNAHTTRAEYSQLRLSFAVLDQDTVEVDFSVEHESEYELPFRTIWWELPVGDKRKIVSNSAKRVLSVVGDDGRFGLRMSDWEFVESREASRERYSLKQSGDV